MERKKGIAPSGIVVFVIFSLALSPVMSLMQQNIMISNSGSIANPAPLITGLPSANVYVVRDDSVGNYVTFNGSNPTQVLETNTNPVTAINNAIKNWVPTNGKLATNGTMTNWYGTVTPTHGNFTWEAWKTKATQISTTTSLIYGVNVAHDFITINNLTYVGRNSVSEPEIGIGTYGSNYMTVENCTITGCTIGGIYINSATSSVGNSIRFNNVSFNYGASQINAEHISNSTFSYNTCDAGGNGQGITTFGSIDGQMNVNITHNVILNWGQNPDHGEAMLRHGIYNSGLAYSYIYNNTFTNTFASQGSDCQIKSPENHIFNNTFNGQSGSTWAFDAYEEPGGVSDWWASANGTMLYSNGFTNYRTGAIYESVHHSATLTDFSIGNITIANNTFVNCGVGIITDSSATATVENFTIVGNSFTTCTTAIALGYGGSPSWNTNSMIILNNTITNATRGILIYSGSNNSTVRYNTFSSCATPITDSSTTSTFRFNVGLTGYYMLNVTVVGSGSTSPSGLGWQYSSGSTASVTWTPSAGYARQDISIDGTNQSTTASPVNVTMSANHVIVAYFVGAP